MPVPRIDSAATRRSCWSSVNHGENGLIYHFKYLNMFINSSILQNFAGYLRLACEWDSYGLSVVTVKLGIGMCGDGGMGKDWDGLKHHSTCKTQIQQISMH